MMRVEDWALVDDGADSPHTRTLFALSNGFLGLRGAREEDLDTADQAFANGFFETWPIVYPEDAYGLARVGQTIQPIANPARFDLAVNGRRYDPATDTLTGVVRRLDWRTGLLTRTATWLVDGVTVRVDTRRLVSLVERGAGLVEYRVTPDAPCDVALTNTLVLPQSGDPRGGLDPRRSTRLADAITVSDVGADECLHATLTTWVAQQRLTCAVAHAVTTDALSVEESGQSEAGPYRRVSAHLTAGGALTLTALVQVDADAGAATTALARVTDHPGEALIAAQAKALAAWWEVADVQVGAPGDLQGRIRWHLWQILQASACTGGLSIPAKGVTGSGYDGHYFWDAEAMVIPVLVYSAPEFARQALSYRHRILPQARERAAELRLAGAAFAWRTIDGREASAYFEAGTAQYHINADIAYAVNRYLAATGDNPFLASEGIDLLVETARLWASLGFFGRDGAFHLHGVTGPDEYSALVNDNLYTNVMAATNLTLAERWLRTLAQTDPPAHATALSRLRLDPAEPPAWRAAATAMALPYDPVLRVHAQDAAFLTHPVWDFAGTPPDMYPLLLHFHPLTIYSHQVLKQGDAILAAINRPDLFTADDKRAIFDYYDPLTTGDSTLSASGQAIAAAEAGRTDLALRYFLASLDTDLANTHANSGDGVHVASAAAVWATLVMGFGGFRDWDGYSIDPHLPADWSSLRFRLRLRGSGIEVTLTHDDTRVTWLWGPPVDITLAGETVHVAEDAPRSSRVIPTAAP